MSHLHFAYVLTEHSLQRYDPRQDIANPEASFILIWDGKERRHLVIIDLEFREGYGRVSHSEVLRKFRGLGFDKFDVLGGGVLRRVPQFPENLTWNEVSSWHSEALGEIKWWDRHDAEECLGILGSK